MDADDTVDTNTRKKNATNNASSTTATEISLLSVCKHSTVILPLQISRNLPSLHGRHQIQNTPVVTTDQTSVLLDVVNVTSQSKMRNDVIKEFKSENIGRCINVQRVS